MTKSAVIFTEGLKRCFDEITAVDNLNLVVYPGEVLGFLGHNGAGKTTTVRLLNGVLTPTAGRAEVLGMDPSTQGAELRRRTGVLTETPSVDERLTGYENLAVFAALYHVPAGDIDRRVAELLEIFQLSDRGADRVSEYSKGMKQKLALARALVHQPEILFLDEPTSGLDPVITRQVHTLIRDLSRDGGHTVFLCTHNLAEAQRLCDRVAVLENGKLVALGTPSELAGELWKGMRIELETSLAAVPAAVGVLENIADVRDIHHAGDDPVICLSLNLRDQVPGLVARLVGAGVPLFRLTPKEPTLEDIYFALHENNKAVTI